MAASLVLDFLRERAMTLTTKAIRRELDGEALKVHPDFEPSQDYFDALLDTKSPEFKAQVERFIGTTGEGLGYERKTVPPPEEPAKPKPKPGFHISLGKDEDGKAQIGMSLTTKSGETHSKNISLGGKGDQQIEQDEGDTSNSFDFQDDEFDDDF